MRVCLAWCTLNVNLRLSTQCGRGALPPPPGPDAVLPAFFGVRQGPPSWYAVYAAEGSVFPFCGVSNGSPAKIAYEHPLTGFAATLVKSSRLRPPLHSTPRLQTAP